MSERKKEQRELVRDRCRSAIRDLYHNATPRYPRLDDRQAAEFQSWFDSAAEFEIEYLGSGGAYGSLRADCNAGRYTSERARQFYIASKLRSMRLERERYALWECISDYGELTQCGRGGRTLAPASLVKWRGGSGFSIVEDYGDGLQYVDCIELLRVVESFNRAVSSWCAAVPEMWREHVETERAERRAVAARKREAQRKERAEREFWAARDVVTRA